MTAPSPSARPTFPRFPPTAARRWGALLLFLATAAGSLRAQAPPAPAPPVEPEIDHVVLHTGERIGGTLLALNEQQLIIRTARWGNVHIPRARIATMMLRTTTFDTTLFPTPAEVIASRHTSPDTPLPRPGRVFSVMPGDAAAPGNFPSAGPLNPLNERLMVPSDMSAFSDFRLDTRLFLTVRHGHSVVLREMGGEVAVGGAEGWHPIPRAGFQWGDGTKWQVAGSGRADFLFLGGTSLIARGPAELTLVTAAPPAAEGEMAATSLRLAQGSALIENPAGTSISIALPTMEVAGRVARLGVRYDTTTGTRLTVFSGEIEARWPGQAAPLRVANGQGVRIDPAGGILGPSPVSEAELTDFR